MNYHPVLRRLLERVGYVVTGEIRVFLDTKENRAGITGGLTACSFQIETFGPNFIDWFVGDRNGRLEADISATKFEMFSLEWSECDPTIIPLLEGDHVFTLPEMIAVVALEQICPAVKLHGPLLTREASNVFYMMPRCVVPRNASVSDPGRELCVAHVKPGRTGYYFGANNPLIPTTGWGAGSRVFNKARLPSERAAPEFAAVA